MTAHVPDLAPGNRVVVHDDPVTRRRVEGFAILVSNKGSTCMVDGVTLELWSLRFEADFHGTLEDEVHLRWVGPYSRAPRKGSSEAPPV